MEIGGRDFGVDDLAVADTGVPQGDGGGDIAGLEGADIHRGIPP